MFGTIFVADDGTERGRDALRLSRLLAAPETEFVIGSKGSPDDVAEAARAVGADLVVMSHRDDVAQLLHGCALPVAVAPPGMSERPEDRLRVIGVGFDGQPESRAALRVAERLALEHGATMRVFAIAPPVDWSSSRIEPTPDEYRAMLQASLGEQLREDVETLDSGVRAAATVVKGYPAQVLAEKSQEGLDLLVLGSRGHGPLRRVAFGSVSSRLLHDAECPVLILPRSATSDEELNGETVEAAR